MWFLIPTHGLDPPPTDPKCDAEDRRHEDGQHDPRRHEVEGHGVVTPLQAGQRRLRAPEVSNERGPEVQGHGEAEDDQGVEELAEDAVIGGGRVNHDTDQDIHHAHNWRMIQIINLKKASR